MSHYLLFCYVIYHGRSDSCLHVALKHILQQQKEQRMTTTHTIQFI